MSYTGMMSVKAQPILAVRDVQHRKNLPLE
jgi:hypothetical protein